MYVRAPTKDKRGKWQSRWEKWECIGIAVARVVLCPKSLVSIPEARCPAAGDCYREPWHVRGVIYKLLIPDALLHVFLAVSVHRLSDWQHTVHSVAALMCSGCGLMTCNGGPVCLNHTQRYVDMQRCVMTWESNVHTLYTPTPTCVRHDHWQMRNLKKEIVIGKLLILMWLSMT